MYHLEQREELVQRLTIPDLSGTLTKDLIVTEGMQGVALGPQPQTYPPGEHRVVMLWRRLFGKVGDRRWALLPATPFAFRVPIPRLRAGDGTWVDVDVMLALRVIQPARAATACPTTLSDLAADLSAALEPVARQTVTQWAAADLAHPKINGRLAAALRPALDAQTETYGLAVERLIAVTVRESEDAVVEARKRDEIEMEKQIDALTTRAEWLDFIRNFKTDFGLTTATVDALLDDMDEERFDAARLRQAVKAAAAGDEAALTVRTQRILGESGGAPAPLPPAPWERAIPWLKLLSGLVLFVGLALTALAPLIALANAGLVLLVTALAAIVLSVVAFWLEQQAAIRRHTDVKPFLEQLGKGDRKRMDRIVREQLARELQTLQQKINDTRVHAFREERREEALALKSVEQRADRMRRDVMAETHGVAAYLTQANIARQQLAAMLTYDETVLAQSAALGDVGEQVRQQVLNATLTDQAIKDLEIALSELEHQIQARARFIQSPNL